MVNLISLAKLATELNINKSKLNFYASRKLLVPALVCGKTMLFDRKKAIQRLNRIEIEQSNGLTLSAIHSLLK